MSDPAASSVASALQEDFNYLIVKEATRAVLVGGLTVGMKCTV